MGVEPQPATRGLHGSGVDLVEAGDLVPRIGNTEQFANVGEQPSGKRACRACHAQKHH